MGGIDEFHRYQHSWEDMLARHDAFTAALSDRITVLHAAGRLEQEAGALYAELAESTVPPSEGWRHRIMPKGLVSERNLNSRAYVVI